MFKKGPFTKTEQNLIDEALLKIFKDEGKVIDVRREKNFLSFSKKELPRNFWKKVASHLPLRTVESVYDHVRRRLSSRNYRGKWSEDEVIKLKNLINIYGKKWTEIGLNLNRLPGACYDKWRDALKNENKRKKGKWTQEEKSKLIHLVTAQMGHEFLENTVLKFVKWTKIAEKIISRSYLQSRNEWARFFISSSNVKLTISDSYRLAKLIFFSKVKDETEIKWGELVRGIPAHKSYSRWKVLCKNFLKNNSKIQTVCFETGVFIMKSNIHSFLNQKNLRKKYFLKYSP